MKKDDFNSSSPEKLRQSAENYTRKTGIKMNPNEKIANGIISALLRNKEFKGEIYCPCRKTTGDKNKDQEIICPCVFHRGEIELQGHCHCNLFVA